MNILVTGGLGFVGSNLVDKLVQDGHNVSVIDNMSSESSTLNHRNKLATYYISCITDVDKIKGMPRFDVIYHLAGLARIQPSFITPIDYININITGTASICELAKRDKSLLIYSSSSSINNGEYKTPYTYSKWGGEEALKTWIQCFNIKAIMCRFYNVYGPREPQHGDYATVVRKFIRQYKNNEPLTIVGDGSQRRDFTHVYDIIDGLIAISERGTVGELYHLGRGVNFSIKELAQMFNDAKVEYVPYRKGEGKVTLANYQETFEKLGWYATRNIKDYICNIS
jgi:UDP-glucose 4-epimerase